MTDETPDTELPDGGLTPEAIERLRARLEAPPAPDGALDRARAAALEAFDEVHDTGEAATDPVRAIGSAPTARRQSWYQRVPLGAAAAVVAAVALVGAVTQLDLSSSDGDDSATAAFDESSEAFEDSSGDSGDGSLDLDAAEDDTTAGAVAGGGSSQGESAPNAGPVGEPAAYDDVDALVVDFQQRFGTGGAGSADGGGGDAPDAAPTSTASRGTDYQAASCDAVDAAGVEPARVRSEEPVVLGPPNGRTQATAVVYESDTSGLRVAVVDAASCDLVADRAL